MKHRPMDDEALSVEVVYALPQRQYVIKAIVTAGCSIGEAIFASGIATHFPDMDLSKQKIGVFSQARSLSDLVKEGDRIEIYRPLLVDPKEARRVKAKRLERLYAVKPLLFE